MKRLAAILMLGLVLNGCVMKVPLNDSLLPTVTSEKPGASVMRQYVMYEYDAKNNAIKITDISAKQPISDSLHAMYTTNWNMYKRNSNVVVSDCIYIKSDKVFEYCNSTHSGGTFWELSVYHDSIYSTAFTLGLISPIPLVWPVAALLMPNIAARAMSTKRATTFGELILKGAGNAN